MKIRVTVVNGCESVVMIVVTVGDVDAGSVVKVGAGGDDGTGVTDTDDTEIGGTGMHLKSDQEPEFIMFARRTVVAKPCEGHRCCRLVIS